MRNKTSQKKLQHGLVFGKFMPLHKGHLHLLRFAEASCKRLTILVCTLPNEPIPGEVRYKWVKELFPRATVIHHDTVIPQHPSEHTDFWNIWKESIISHCKRHNFDAMFGSEDYGWKMASTLGIEYVPVNRFRTLVTVSGTAVRDNPMKEWKYLPAVVRPYFVKRIRIVGPESAGKSTLAVKLAELYQTNHVHEYARNLLDEYVENRGYRPGEVRYKDIMTIARGQIATEDALARQANRLLFCDTDVQTTVFWSNYYFKKCPAWIVKEAQRRHYDLTLLLAPDVPWIDDSQRPMKNLSERQQFFDRWKDELDRRGDRYVIVSGDWDTRLQTASDAIHTLQATHQSSPVAVKITTGRTLSP